MSKNKQKEKCIYRRSGFVVFFVFCMLIFFGLSVWGLTSTIGTHLKGYSYLRPLKINMILQIGGYGAATLTSFIAIFCVGNSKRYFPTTFLFLVVAFAFLREFVNFLSAPAGQYGFTVFGVIFVLLLISSIFNIVAKSKHDDKKARVSYYLAFVALLALIIYFVVSLIFTFKGLKELRANYAMLEKPYIKAAEGLEYEERHLWFISGAFQIMYVTTFLVPIFMTLLSIFPLFALLSPLRAIEKD